MLEQDWLAPYLDRMVEMSRRFFRHFHARLEEVGGLSPSQFFLLRILEQAGACTVSDLAQRLDMTVAGATGLIDRLVKAKLVTRHRGEEDRRVVRVALSPEGARQAAAACRQRREVMAEFFGALEPGEVAQLVTLYEKLIRAIPEPGSDCKAKE